MTSHWRSVFSKVLALLLMLTLVLPSTAMAVKPYDEQSYEIQTLDAIDFGAIDFNSDWKFYLSTIEGNYVEEIIGANGRVSGDSLMKGLKDGEDGPQTADIIKPDFDDSSWRTVSAPHDWGFEFTPFRDPTGTITSRGAGYLPGGVGFYRKTFVVPAELEGKKISVEFDGVYMDSKVYVNGEFIGEYPDGYIGFCYDISDHLIYGGENVIAVRCSDKVSSSRWYSGRGIIRPVRILVDTDTRFVRNGVYLATPTIGDTYPVDQTADILVTADVYSVKDVAAANIVTKLYDADGEVFAEAASEAIPLAANEKATICQTVNTVNAKLWDTVTPNLYQAVVELYDGDKLVDSYETSFGFKWFTASANNGFALNGNFILIHGVNLHHENGIVGPVSEADVMYRKVKLMKDMGVNAIRTCHNPENQYLMDACNKLGVLVVEENSDKVSGGSGWMEWYSVEVPADWAGAPDGGLPTQTLATDGTLKDAPYCWGDQHMQEMVSIHRNNVCIAMWSTANELHTPGEVPEWATPELLKDLYAMDFNPEPQFGLDTEVIRMAQRALQIDPYHIIVQASDEFRDSVEATRARSQEQWINCARYLEAIGGVLGTQYSAVHTIEDIHKWFPNLAQLETESSYIHQGKGPYFGAELSSVSFNYTAGRLSSGGYNNPDVRLPGNRDYTMKMVRDYGMINGGHFIWTGIDNMGEGMDPQIPNEPDLAATNGNGMVDMAGFPKDVYYMHQSQWLDKETHPMVYIAPSDWNQWTEGQDVKVLVWTNCPKAELFLNGESLGVREFEEKTTEYGLKYYETHEPTSDNALNTSDVNPGGYVSPNGEYGNLYLHWYVPYTAGELKAVAYDDDGSVKAEYTVNTFSAPKTIVLEADKEAMKDDGDGYVFVTASIVDENGVVCRDADMTLYVEVEGAKIAGVSNGYQGEHECTKFGGTQYSYYSEHLSHMGLLEIAVKSEDAGKVTLKVWGDGLETGYINFFSVDDEEGVAGYKDAYIRVPVGAELKLPEEVIAVNKDGSEEAVAANWSEAPKTDAAGLYEVESSTGAKAYVTVYEVAEIAPVTLKVYGNAEPVLPAYVNVTYSDGLTGIEAVEWNGLEGTVAGTEIKAAAVIENKEAGVNLLDASQFAIDSTASFTSGATRQIANALDNDMASCWDNRVSTSGSLIGVNVPENTSLYDTFVEFTWDEYQTFNDLDVYFVIGDLLPDAIQEVRSRYFGGGDAGIVRSAAIPANFIVQYWDGMQWIEAENLSVDVATETLTPTSVKFDTITTSRVRLFMFNATPYTEEGTIQIAQMEAYLK